MQEIELKFNVASTRQSIIEYQIGTKTAKKQTLFACYFDTPDNLLAKQGIALRIRYENGQWVQTLKNKGDGVAQRIELNYQLAFTEDPKTINIQQLSPDLTKIDNPEILAQLNAIMPLEILAKSLQINYFTDIKRLSRLIKKNNSQIEIAYDTGKIVAGDKQYLVNELEFELIKGEVSDLIFVAKKWCKRHQLYLSTISKAQRGNLLLVNKEHANPVKADLSQLKLNSDMDEFSFLQQTIKNCLIQILPNATAIADGSPNGDHVHQLRVGIRRLRSLLKIFKNQQIEKEWLDTLKQTFSQLGEYRDKEILLTKTQPMLEQQGSPHVEWSLDVPVTPIKAVKNNEFQQVLLNLINFVHLPIVVDNDVLDNQLESVKARKIAGKKLDKLFKKVVKASENFAKLDTESQHNIRKDLKTLRYVSELVAPLFYQTDVKKLNKFLNALEPVQDVLGEYNDNAVGYGYYQTKAKDDPKALFAVGWFAGQQPQMIKNCAKSLKNVKNAPKFW